MRVSKFYFVGALEEERDELAEEGVRVRVLLVQLDHKVQQGHAVQILVAHEQGAFV